MNSPTYRKGSVVATFKERLDSALVELNNLHAGVKLEYDSPNCPPSRQQHLRDVKTMLNNINEAWRSARNANNGSQLTNAEVDAEVTSVTEQLEEAKRLLQQPDTDDHHSGDMADVQPEDLRSNDGPPVTREASVTEASDTPPQKKTRRVRSTSNPDETRRMVGPPADPMPAGRVRGVIRAITTAHAVNQHGRKTN